MKAGAAMSDKKNKAGSKENVPDVLTFVSTTMPVPQKAGDETVIRERIRHHILYQWQSLVSKKSPGG